jgi:hypothetical protein
MNLTNRRVTLTTLTSTTYPEMSRATVAVSEEVIPGVQKTIGTYTLEIQRVFSSTSDPNLLAAIQEMLEAIPE